MLASVSATFIRAMVNSENKLREFSDFSSGILVFMFVGILKLSYFFCNPADNCLRAFRGFFFSVSFFFIGKHSKKVFLVSAIIFLSIEMLSISLDLASFFALAPLKVREKGIV